MKRAKTIDGRNREMKRAAVIIGVDRCGDLPLLRDAASGALRFEKWVLGSQKFTPDQVKVLTDQNRLVELSDIKKAVKALVDVNTPPDQLLIYFAGHGVNIGYSEYWLLSDALRDTQAAVNVARSEVLARYCGVPHVVMISDACRSPAAGINAQWVNGGEIFLNDSVTELENPVDQFFACTLGRPALEVKKPSADSHEFRALYTDALLHGLRGHEPRIVDWQVQDGSKVGYVRPWALKAWLSQVVPQRLSERGLAVKANQVPDARITSGPGSWLSLCSTETLEMSGSAAAEALEQSVYRFSDNRSRYSRERSLKRFLKRLFRSVLQGELEFHRGIQPQSMEEKLVVEEITRLRAPVDEYQEYTGPSFLIVGNEFSDAMHPAGIKEQSSHRVVLNSSADGRCPAQVLLTLSVGGGTVLPVFNGFCARLSVSDDEIIDVAYERCAPGGSPAIDARQKEKIRALRAIAAVSSRQGLFTIEPDEAGPVVNLLNSSRFLDPSLALYFCYGLAEAGHRDAVLDVARRMQAELGIAFPDLYLHSRAASEIEVRPHGEPLPRTPALSKGWALAGAFSAPASDELLTLRFHLRPSLWTLFNANGIDLLRRSLQQGRPI